MDLEEGKKVENVTISINRSVLLQGLSIGTLSALITGVLLFYHAGSILMFGASMIFGFTLGFLGIYLLLISKPLFSGEIHFKVPGSEEDLDEIEFHSTMKIE